MATKKYLDQTGLAEVAGVVNSKARIFYGTQAEWNELPLAKKIKYDYVASDEEDDPITAATVSYDNTESGLESTNVQSAIDETQGRITAPYVLQGRRFICIGDSYSIGQNPEHSTGGRGWCFYLKKYLNVPTEDFFMPTAADVGSLPGFYPTSGTHKSFKDQLITMESYVDDLSTITDIVVAGGYNDAAIDDEMLVTQGFGDFIEHVNTTFTNVNVWVGCIGATTNLTKAGFNLALEIPYIYSKSCVSQTNSSDVDQTGNKFRYLDNCESAFRYYEQMSTDKIHPTELGYNILSYTLASAIKGYHGNDMYYGWLYEDSNYEASDFGTTSEHWFKNAFTKDPANSFDKAKYGTTMIFEQIKNNMAFLTVTFGAINNPTLNNWEYPQDVWWISNSGLSIKTKPYFEVLKFTSGLIIPTGLSECEVVVPAAFYTEWSNGTNRLGQVVSGNYIISNQGVKVQLNATHITNQTPEYKLVLISMSGFSCTFPATFA